MSIRATFPGASAQTLQNSVTQVIEQQLTGIDGLLYFQSSSSSRGSVTITATFAKGTDPDIAQVQSRTKSSNRSPACRNRCSNRAWSSASRTPTSC